MGHGLSMHLFDVKRLPLQLFIIIIIIIIIAVIFRGFSDIFKC